MDCRPETTTRFSIQCNWTGLIGILDPPNPEAGVLRAVEEAYGAVEILYQDELDR